MVASFLVSSVSKVSMSIWRSNAALVLVAWVSVCPRRECAPSDRYGHNMCHDFLEFRCLRSVCSLLESRGWH